MTVCAIEPIEADSHRVASEASADVLSSPATKASFPTVGFHNLLAAAAPDASTSAAPRAHAVQPGETLWGIVENRLKQSGQPAQPTDVAAAVRQIASANAMKNPNFILAGQTIDLSSLQKTTQTVNDAKPSPVLTPTAGAISPPLPTSVSVYASLAKPSVDVALPLPHDVPVAVGGPSKDATELRPEATRQSVDLADLLQKILSPVTDTQTTEQTKSPWSRVLAKSAHLTSEYGMRRDPFTGQPQFHDGIDLATSTGTRIHPFRSGVVVKSGWESGYGKMVKVRHPNGLESVYGHTLINLVQEGDEVDENTTLALVGSSGRSTGPHLHFEVRRNGRSVNPVPFLTGPYSK